MLTAGRLRASCWRDLRRAVRLINAGLFVAGLLIGYAVSSMVYELPSQAKALKGGFCFECGSPF